jgi:phosphoribosylformylglycinamidine synthase subunit PurL
VRSMIRAGVTTAVHDLSDGGLLVAVAEMALAGRIGARLDAPHGPSHGYFFGEDQARYIVTVPEHAVGTVIDAASGAGVTAARIGTTGGDRLIPGEEAPILLSELRESHEGWFPRYMAGPAADAAPAA